MLVCHDENSTVAMGSDTEKKEISPAATIDVL